MEAPEGFRNSDDECFSESQVIRITGFLHKACDITFCNACYSFAVFQKESSMEDVQDLTEIEMPHNLEEHGEEKGAEPPGETTQHVQLFVRQLFTQTHLGFPSSGENASPGQSERPSTPGVLATTVFWRTTAKPFSPLWSPCPCHLEGLEDVLLEPTNKLVHWSGACARVCLVVTSWLKAPHLPTTGKHPVKYSWIHHTLHVAWVYA